MKVAKSIFTAPWYTWYVKDALTSERVELMSLAEEGAYRRALDKCWLEGSIPSDPAKCAKTIGKGCSVKVATVVLTMFEPMPGRSDRAVNKKLEKIRKEQEKKYKKKSDAGRENVLKRWRKRASGDTNGNTTVIPKNSIQKEKENLPTEDKEDTHTGDQRLSHPAVVAMQEVTGIRPSRDQLDEIVERMGFEVDVGKLKDVYRKWRAKGYGKTNYDGIIDWYHNGIPKSGAKGNGSNRQHSRDAGRRPTPAETIRNRPYR